jgi:hypothetical protein
MAENRVSIYVLAGVATSSNFMEDFVQELQHRYDQAGFEVLINMIFPYGDWKRSIIKQLKEISYDLLPRLGQKRNYLRGQKVADYIKESYKGGKIVIIGHSSGGVVGVHAANILYGEKLPVARVVQIGSPKCPVTLNHRTSTLFIFSVNHKDKISDPISYFGSWGGMEKRGRVFRWNPRLSAPTSIIGVPIIGGHADYFRNRIPFVDRNGMTNLEKTTNLIWEWLDRQKY